MADNQSTIALNIGSQRVSLAVFEASKSGTPVLKAYETESFLVDPANESSRVSQTRSAIESLVGRMKLKGKIRYAISGQSVFVRFVKLPPLDDDNIEQLVTFEAQQHVPFPLDQVVWDYEVLEAAGEKEVVIVAIKSDALDEINESANIGGLVTSEVDVAPMALYNAFRAAYPDLSEPSLLIDVGAKTSDLLYIEGPRFFTRSAAVGGATISNAIAKEFGVGFTEAENHKVENGMVALGGGHTDQMDETQAALATCIRNAMTKLAAEVPRTTNYYRSQHNGNAPKRVFLAGGGANLPYVKEFFEEKLRLPVEYFNPLGAITLGKGVDQERISREAHRMGEVIGLGLRGSGRSSLNIDLVPAKVGQARAAEKRRPFLIAAAAALILGVGAWAFFQSQAAASAADKAEDMVRQQETLSAPASSISRLISEEEDLRGVASPYVEAEENRTFWIDMLQELKVAFSSDVVWLVDFIPLSGYQPLADEKGGKEVVEADFVRAPYGSGMLKEPTGGEDEAVPTVNAIRIKGFWRKNPQSQNAVYNLIEKLRANAEGGSSHFSFAASNEDGETVVLEEKDVVAAIQAAPGADEFAAPFELLLPLSREVPIR